MALTLKNKILQDTLRHDAFSVQSPEADFWAGFIAADGCINKDAGLELCLANKDLAFLSLFRDWVGSLHKLTTRIYSDGRVGCRLSFSSKKIVEDLEQFYSITPAKTHTLQPPQRQSLYFVAGYFMGDGTLTYSPARPPREAQWRAAFVGTEVFLDWVSTYFQEYSGARPYLHPSNVYVLGYQSRQTPKIARLIFDHAPFMIARKKNKYEEMLCSLIL